MSATDSKSKAAADTAAADAALAAALKENAKLKKRLAKLQRIENGLDSDPSGRGVTIEKEVCLAAFNDFDVDKSGYIDKSELSLLATDLGAALDNRELESAYKQIDTSGDGKIQFEEFYKWWNGQGGMQGGETDLMKLALLRARLVAFKGKKVMDALAAGAKKSGLIKEKPAPAAAAAAAPAATASGASGGGAKDTKTGDSKSSSSDSKEPEVAAPAGSHTHTVRVSVGEFDKAAMRIALAIKQNYAGDPQLLSGVTGGGDPGKHGLFVSVDIKSQGKTDFVEYLSQLAKTWSRVLSEQSIVLSVCTPPNTKDIARVTVGLPVPIPDPAHMFRAIGLSLDSITRLASVNVEFGHSLGDFFDFSKTASGGGLALFDLFCFRAAVKIVADPDLLNTLRHLPIEPVTNMASAAARARARKQSGFITLIAPILSNLDTATNLTFGDSRELFQTALDHDPKLKNNAKAREGLQLGVTPLPALIEEKLKQAIANDRPNEMRIGFSAFRGMMLTLARDFNEIVGASVWSRSGLAAELKLDGVMVLSQFVEAFTALEQIIATVPRNPGGVGAGGGAARHNQNRRYHD